MLDVMVVKRPTKLIMMFVIIPLIFFVNAK